MTSKPREFPETLAGAQVSDIDLDVEQFVFRGERLTKQRSREIADELHRSR